MPHHKYLLLGILILALVVRVWSLGSLPAGFTPDEAAFGYNAYSILTTGMDEWGTPWYVLPFTNLKSFGDFKLPLYTYLTLPSVALFGLNEFAIRLPNAVIGTLVILLTYQLTLQLLSTHIPQFKYSASHFAALLLAISPWHISMSRGAFEANLITLAIPAMLLAYLNQRYLVTCLWFAFSIYSYHSAKVLAPLTLIIVMVLFPAKLRSLVPAVILLAFLITPAFMSSLGLSGSRAADVAITNPTDSWQAVAARRYLGVLQGLPDPISRLFSNKITYSFHQFIANYLSYFSPTYFFTSGAGEWTYGTISGRGLLYYVQIPLLFFGVSALLKNRNRSTVLILSLLLLAPIPAALSKGPGFAANRSVLMVIPLTILTSIGFGQLLSNKKARLFIMAAVFVNFVFFAEDYLYHAPNHTARHGFYGWSTVVSFLNSIPHGPNSLVKISRSLSEPHIGLAFYSRLDPTIYQSFSKTWPDPHSDGKSFLDQHDGYWLNAYRFGDIYPSDPVSVPTYYIGRANDFPPSLQTTVLVSYPDQSPAVVAYFASP
jgi:hypothetical protein